MEKLSQKYKTAKQSLETLEESVKRLESGNSANDESLEKMIRDSAIKRFEYTLDVTWKYLKLYIKDKFGIEENSPKSVFRACLTNKILTEEQTTQAIEMVNDRNLATHTYNQELAENIAQELGDYQNLLKIILEKTAKQYVP